MKEKEALNKLKFKQIATNNKLAQEIKHLASQLDMMNFSSDEDF